MTVRILPILVLALAANPLRAQAPLDSAGIARAAARLIAEVVVPEIEIVPDVVIGEAATGFDSLVAAEMARLPAFQRPVRDPARAARVITRGLLAERPYAPADLRGLPAVVVRVSGCTPVDDEDGEPRRWRWWANQTDYVFRRTADGWEPVDATVLDNADGGCSPPAPAGSR